MAAARPLCAALAFLLLLGCRAAPLRQLRQDPEGAALSSISTYVKYVDTCGSAGKASTPACTALRTQLCGYAAQDTSEVLCSKEGGQEVAQFRSASRYTRVGYLRCQLAKPTCMTDKEALGFKQSPTAVNPRALAAWVDYASRCPSNVFDAKKTPAATCFNQRQELCSRPDVKCGKGFAEFTEASPRSASKKVVMRGDEATGLVHFVK